MERENLESFLPRKIEGRHIEPIPPEVDGTAIILQRHGEYERSVDSPQVGSLTEAGIRNIYEGAKTYFSTLFESVPEAERKDLDFLVLASDTQYEGGGRRSIETSDQVMMALKEELNVRNLNESQVLNTSGARSNPKLREPQMFNQSPEFVQFLKDKYGDRGLQFWIAFEEDKEKETREQMGAEGPDEITDRMKLMVEVLTRYSQFYHRKHPGKRLVIWGATHYDTISPFVKRELFGVGKEIPLGVDYGAGISIRLDKDGKRSANIDGNEYELPRD